jgi:four helix bundle protein
MCLTLAVTQRHENLVAWQRADDLCLMIHKLSRELPREQRFELASQLRRAAYSVAANIVEGYAYESRTMRLKHVRIAIGSLAEVGYGIHMARRLGYLSPSRLGEVEDMLRLTAAPLHGLVTHLKRERGAREDQ